MLKLRRARVLSAGPLDAAEQQLTVVLEHDAEPRAAIAQVGLVGACGRNDEVIVNVEARDLGLGSGGFDIVHVNLSRGLSGAGPPGAHVMKLNYTSLQHVVAPVEERWGDSPVPSALGKPVAVLALHGQLAAVAWSLAQVLPAARLGYVQTAGGALAGGHSRVVRRLREGGLLAGHLSAGSCFGGEAEAISTAGALVHGFSELGWDAAVCGPGPGIVGSASPLGHGGMVALDSAHAALALGCDTVLVARMSRADERPRHRGLSHHTLTVLELLLAPVTVALPQGLLEADSLPPSTVRHRWRRMPVDLDGYASSGLPLETMGRPLPDDPLFFAAALAGGAALARPRPGASGPATDASTEEDQQP